ncbi:hypothetical protein ACFYPC_15695 [Streptomyces sp. NPDC005808]|uniref:hypothetical protein n=1 Tax=Streptomyces sp. NPDC005808 TaxID=3364734 RepID=UPI00367F85A7
MTTPAWFVELLAVSEALAAVDRADIAAWRGPGADDADPDPAGDDVPPLSVRLGSLGREFAEHSAELSPAQRREVLRILEEVQVSGGEADGTAVTTGFFEALLSAWDRGFDLRTIWPDIGPDSRAYCLAWNRFIGVESPDWMS